MKFSVLVGEVMTKSIKRVAPDEPIEKAAKIMRDEKIGSVVVMGGKNVKGIVTTTDIVYKHVIGNKGKIVSDIMSADVVKISPSATIEEAARLMVKNNIEKVLVFDKDALVGIITNNDIIKVEPAIVEILLDRMRTDSAVPTDAEILECEGCGAYADNVEEVNGVYLCSDCRSGDEVTD